MSRTQEATAAWLYLEWVYKRLTAWQVQITIFLLIFSVPMKSLIGCRSLGLWRNPSWTVIAYEELSLIALLWYLTLTFPLRGEVISVWFRSSYFCFSPKFNKQNKINFPKYSLYSLAESYFYYLLYSYSTSNY